jgi:hypothetical protein
MLQQAFPQVTAELFVGENGARADQVPDGGLNAAVKLRTVAAAVLNGREVRLTHTGGTGDFGLGETVADPMVAQDLSVHRASIEPIYVAI